MKSWFSLSFAAAVLGALLLPRNTQAQNLFRNPSFESIPGAVFNQGILPSEWIQALGLFADTYSSDGTYGLTPDSFGNFTGATAQDGVRWVAGASFSSPERFGQILTTTLAPGSTYELSGYIRQAVRSDLAHPSTYEISLADNAALNTNVVIGTFSPVTTNTTDWDFRTLSFVAPANAASLPVLVFTPVGPSGLAYPGLDNVSLILQNGNGNPPAGGPGNGGTDVPEPGALAFTLGAAFFLAAARTKVRKPVSPR